MAGVITVISTPLIFTGGSIFFGIIALSLTVVFWTGFVLLSGLDEYTVHEKERILSLDEQGTNFQLTKSMTKISFFFLFGLISLIIFVAIFRFLDVNIYLTLEIISFLNELQNLPMLLQNPWTWIIGIECTIFPYFIYFQSQNNWPSRSLNWDQWVAILAIFEPLASIFVGFFIGAEAIYNTALLTIAIVLMTIVMVLRYYHEKNSVKSVIFIKVKQHGMKNLINRLRYNPNISELKTLTGEYDIALKTFFPSYFKLKQFLDRLKQIDAVIDVNNLIEFELKIK